MEISKYALEATDKYFKALNYIGYKSQSEINKLLILLFIEELLCEDFSMYLKERDLTEISKALKCLQGTSCMIPYTNDVTFIYDDFHRIFCGECSN